MRALESANNSCESGLSTATLGLQVILFLPLHFL